MLELARALLLALAIALARVLLLVLALVLAISERAAIAWRRHPRWAFNTVCLAVGACPGPDLVLALPPPPAPVSRGIDVSVAVTTERVLDSDDDLLDMIENFGGFRKRT